jgi:hypothetical protein
VKVTFPGITCPSPLTARQLSTYFPAASCGAGIEISADDVVGSGPIFFAASASFCSESAVSLAGSANVNTNFGGETVTVLPSAGTAFTRWVCAKASALQAMSAEAPTSRVIFIPSSHCALTLCTNAAPSRKQPAGGPESAARNGWHRCVPVRSRRRRSGWHRCVSMPPTSPPALRLASSARASAARPMPLPAATAAGRESARRLPGTTLTTAMSSGMPSTTATTSLGGAIFG